MKTTEKKMSTLVELIEPHISKPRKKLPKAVQERLSEDHELLGFLWDRIGPDRRREAARQHDWQADSAWNNSDEVKAWGHIGFYGEEYVRTWVELGRVSPLEAALLFHSLDPSKYKGTLPDFGEALNLMLRRFEDKYFDRCDRNLRDWLAVACEHNLSGSSVEGWQACVNVLTPSPPQEIGIKVNAPDATKEVSILQIWSLKKPVRYPGYRKALYDFLKTALIVGQSCPKAQDVVDAWKISPPLGIRVITHGIEYQLDTNQSKQADLKAIQSAIKNLMAMPTN
jgi:hypothetical protein